MKAKIRIYIILAAAAIAVICAAAFFLYAAGTDKAENERTISILSGQRYTKDIYLDQLQRHFPNLSFEFEEIDWGDELTAAIKDRLYIDDMPDIIIGKGQDIGIYKQIGILKPLPMEISERIVPHALDNAVINDTLYGLPYDCLYQGVIYNKDIFEIHDIAIPETKKQMRETVKKLHQYDITPFAMHLSENWPMANIIMQFALNEIFLYEPDWGKRFNADLVSFESSEPMKWCFDNAKYVFDNTWSDSFRVDNDESSRRFFRGEAAMFLTGIWSLENMYEYNPDISLGIFPYPNEKGASHLIYEVNTTFMKTASEENSAIADKILEFLVNDDTLADKLLGKSMNYSLLKDYEPEYPNVLNSSIDTYIKEGRIIDAYTGNSQLIWEFQAEYSDYAMYWLEKKIALEDVLNYADRDRQLNIPSGS